MKFIADTGELAELAVMVMENEPEMEHLEVDCRIIFQRGSEEKITNGQTVYADCGKVPDKLKAFVPADYLITFYESSRQLTRDGMYVLMYHELMHIDTDGERFRVRKHDVEEFRAVAARFGLDWIEKYSGQISLDEVAG